MSTVVSVCPCQRTGCKRSTESTPICVTCRIVDTGQNVDVLRDQMIAAISDEPGRNAVTGSLDRVLADNGVSSRAATGWLTVRDYRLIESPAATSEEP